MMAIEFGATSEVFVVFAREVLLPELQRGMTVVLDNLGAGRSKEVWADFEEAGVYLDFTSPYSPELNPIELWWHWLKDRLGTRRARDHETLDAAIDLAMEALPPMVATIWVRHGGHAVKSL